MLKWLDDFGSHNLRSSKILLWFILFIALNRIELVVILFFGRDDGHFVFDDIIFFIQIKWSNWSWSFLPTRAFSFENFIEQQHKTRLQTFHVSIIGC